MTLDLQACNDLMFRSYERVHLTGYDQYTRDLTAMRDLYQRADVPMQFAPAITVTGSKGKGSTSLLCAAMLQGAGRKVGLVTSPNFLDLRERIRLNGRVIPEDAYVRIINHLAPHIDAVQSELASDRYLSPTGLFLAVAARYFAEQDVEAVVLEVGRGGRFDDISLYQNQVSVITPIMGEHLDRLGPTVKDVAWHKSGIIKPANVVVSAPQIAEVRGVIARETAAEGGKLLEVSNDIFYRQMLTGDNAQDVRVTIEETEYQFSLQTRAVYQGLNVAAACGAVKALIDDLSGADNAVSRLRFPGRCDRVHTSPMVVVDGAINEEAAVQFRESMLPLVTAPLVLVTALPQDKDFPGLLETLAPLAQQVIITQVTAKHLHFSDDVVTLARSFNENVIDQPDVDEALRQASALAGVSGTIWIVGTQSLVRDALRFWKQDLDNVFS